MAHRLNENYFDEKTPPLANMDVELAESQHLGTQICWKTGIEKEIAICLETKALAIQRYNENKVYVMDFCRECGACENKMPVREFQRPEIEAELNKQGLGRMRLKGKCKICGVEIIKDTPLRKYCKVCAKAHDLKRRRLAREKMKQKCR